MDVLATKVLIIPLVGLLSSTVVYGFGDGQNTNKKKEKITPSPTKEAPITPDTSSTLLIEDPTDRSSDTVDEDLESSDAELAYNAEERRLEHSQALLVGVGESRPWQTLTVAFGFPLGESSFWGLTSGVGSQSRNGLYQNKTYDMDVRFSSVGFFGRIYSTKFTNLSLEPSVSFHQWSGSVSPFGLDPDEENPEVLTAGFQARGASLGVGFISTWFLSESISLDWTFVGLKKSWLISHSNTRSSRWIDGVTHRVFTSAQFFGLTSITIGFWSH